MVERQILLKLSLPDIENLCLVDEKFNFVCQDDSFWQELFRKWEKDFTIYPSKVQYYNDQFLQLDRWIDWLKISSDHEKPGDPYLPAIHFDGEFMEYFLPTEEKEYFKSLLEDKRWKKFWDVTKHIGDTSAMNLGSFKKSKKLYVQLEYNLEDHYYFPEDLEKDEVGERVYDDHLKMYQLLLSYDDKIEFVMDDEILDVTEEQMKDILRRILNYKVFLSGEWTMMDRNDEEIPWPI